MREADDVERSLLQRFVDFPLVAMVIALVAVSLPAALASGLFERASPPSPATTLISKLIVVGVMVASYKVVVPHLGERQHDDLSGRSAVPQLAAGVGFGTLLFALIVAVAALGGVYRVTGSGDASYLWAAVIGAGLFPAVTEEIIYRAILFRWIEEFAGSWAALILSSALFGLSHIDNPNADMVSTVGIMLEGGILLGGAYMLTRRLWFAMGIHASWNLTQGELFDIPVSGTDAHGLLDAKLQGPAFLTGGGFGLEASLIGISIGTAAGVALVWLAVKRGELVRPRWSRSLAT